LGGGSSMDTAKSVGVEVVHGGSIREYEYGGAASRARIPPLLGVRTPAGNGREATRGAGDNDRGREVRVNAGRLSDHGARARARHRRDARPLAVGTSPRARR